MKPMNALGGSHSLFSACSPPPSLQMMFAIAVGDLRPAILPEVSPLIRSFAEQCIAVDPAERPSVEALCGFLWKETGTTAADNNSGLWP
jgi:hypothetical protein